MSLFAGAVQTRQTRAYMADIAESFLPRVVYGKQHEHMQKP